VSTPQTYTITETNEYSTTDGSKRFTFTAGTVIPMSLAIEMGLEGAGYDDPVYFTDNEQAAILSLAGAQPNYLSTIPLDEVVGTGTMSANRAYLVHFRVGQPVSFGKGTIFVATAAGNADTGVYQSDGTTATRLASNGGTAVTGTGAVQSLTFTTVECVPGVDYYGALALTDGTTAAIARLTGLNANITILGRRLVSFASSYPLPASFTLASGTGSSTLPLLFLEP
jgi:hypothetical protein